MKTEKWAAITDYEGIYQVSSYGRIKSLERITCGCYNSKYTRKERLLKPATNRNGYKVVALCKNSKTKSFLVHRIVGTEFIKNTENKKEINHINSIRSDNMVHNLEWCSKSENMKHAFKRGLKTHKGEKHPMSKLTKSQALEIISFSKKTIKHGDRKKYADKMGVGYYVFNNIYYGRTWKHIRARSE